MIITYIEGRENTMIIINGKIETEAVVSFLLLIRSIMYPGWQASSTLGGGSYGGRTRG